MTMIPIPTDATVTVNVTDLALVSTAALAFVALREHLPDAAVAISVVDDAGGDEAVMAAQQRLALTVATELRS